MSKCPFMKRRGHTVIHRENQPIGWQRLRGRPPVDIVAEIGAVHPGAKECWGWQQPQELGERHKVAFLRSQPQWHLGSRLRAPALWEHTFLLFEATQLMVVCYSSPHPNTIGPRTSEEAHAKTNGKDQNGYVFCISCQCLQESICYTRGLHGQIRGELMSGSLSDN